MLCASSLAYSITPPPPATILPPNSNIPQTAPYYAGAGYTSPPTMIQKSFGACTIGINTDGIVLAFEGTVFSDDWQWLNDLLVPTEVAWGVKGLVSSAFYGDYKDIYDYIVSTLQALIKANPTLPLIITGHSKGASMAPIAAYSLHANHNITASSVYLFAPPLPGDGTFATAYNALFPNTFNYQNYGDIVPLLPPSHANCSTLAGYAPNELIKLAIEGMSIYGYTPVGNIYFIDEPQNGVYPTPVPMNSQLAAEQMAAAGGYLQAKNWAALGAAHSHACGAGYMSSICPEVTCPSASPQN